MKKRGERALSKRFGRGQTAKQERKEIEQAQLAGRESEYLDGQRWSRMIESERERRRERKRGRRDFYRAHR